jgi:hypothetical protein
VTRWPWKKSGCSHDVWQGPTCFPCREQICLVTELLCWGKHSCNIGNTLGPLWEPEGEAGLPRKAAEAVGETNQPCAPSLGPADWGRDYWPKHPHRGDLEAGGVPERVTERVSTTDWECGAADLRTSWGAWFVCLDLGLNWKRTF